MTKTTIKKKHSKRKLLVVSVFVCVCVRFYGYFFFYYGSVIKHEVVSVSVALMSRQLLQSSTPICINEEQNCIIKSFQLQHK